MYRPEKNYLGEALLTLVPCYLGFGIVGLIANILFLNNANRDDRMGVITRNAGCLRVLLWVQVALMVLGCIGVCLWLTLGGWASASSWSGRWY